MHGGAINVLETTQSGLLVTGSADKTVKTFDVGQQKEVMNAKATDSVFCG
jgi:WD40 repeat protein